jgi:long-subunit fatty acid transport protein
VNTGTPLDGQLKLKDDTWSCGANLGILVKPREGTRIGLTCLSPVKLDSHLEILTLDALAAAQDTAERDSTPTITLCPPALASPHFQFDILLVCRRNCATMLQYQ